ncbi:hypothetical protein ACTUHY_05550 [Acidaminococcus sp. LBK-2]|uniref:hypothetical protein n=1 Tax=Acidaminococcus sp. LBK-2 TaxID=3456956 RepID=UPI003FA4B7B9
MPYSVEEALSIAKSEGKSNKLNNDVLKSRTVDPDNLPAFMKPQPEPKSIGQAVEEAITTAVGNPFEAREEEATSQAREQYNAYQNEEIAQPVGVGTMLASARQSINDTLNTPVWKSFGGAVQAAEDAASARAADSEAEYRKSIDDVQNPIAPTYDNPVDTFFHAGLAGGLVGDSYKKSVENTLAFTSNWVRGTEIYNNFNFQWDTPEKNRMSEELARAYGVNSGIFFGDRDAYIKGAQILAQFKIDSRVGDDVDRNDPEAFKAYLAEYYPSLANASQDDFESLIKNAEDVKAVQEIMKVPGLVAETFANSSERADIYGKAYLEGRTLTEDEIARADQLTKRLEELNKMTPQTTLHPLMGILSQTGIQVAGMGSDAAVGAVAAGILGGGAYMMGAPAPIAKKIGSYAFKFGTMAGMYRRQVGEKYIEYLSYQNEDGTRTLTPREAKIAATIETGIETGIEFWNYDAIMSTLSGADRKAIQDIVARNKGNAEAIKGGLKGYLATAVKSWAPRAKEEILEEAYQSATGDIVHNAIVATHPQTTEKMVSVPEITANSMDAMADAVPSVGGMIIGGDILSNIKGVRSLASIARLHNTMTEEAVDNAFTGQVLRDIQENQKTNKLFKENPKAYMQVIKTEMGNAGMPNVYVDVEMLMNEKGGAELVQKLGQQSGYSPSEIQQVIESKGDLEVPTEVYCQTALPASDKIVDMTTSSPDINCTARQKDTIKRFQQNVKALAEQDEQEVQEIIPTIVNENFSDENERKLASEIISGSPNDVQNAYRKALRGAEQEYKNILREVWEREEAASKENHDGTRIVEDKYADDNGNVRVVHNHGTWRDKWWTDYFGIQTPTVEKKEQFAYDIMTGAVAGGPNSLARIRDMAANAGDMDEVGKIDAEMKANKERLDAMANTIATLRGMKDKIAKIQNVETTITRGMTPEAYRVYQRTTDLLNHSVGVNKKVQQAARYDGVLFARMCQRLAEEWTRQGKKTTAEDVAKGLNIVPAGGVADGKTLAQMKKDQLTYVLNSHGDIDFGYIPQAVADDGTILKGAPVRLQIGFHHKGSTYGVGYAHLLRHHVQNVHGGIEAAIKYILSNIDSITQNKKRVEIRSYLNGTPVALILNLNKDNSTNEDFYTVVTLTPQTVSRMNKEKQKALTFGGRLTPPPVSSHGAIHTSSGFNAGPNTGLKPRKVSAFGTVSLANAKKLVKKNTWLNQTAWHGSPNNFDNFMLSHMGEGEGAQVHGWGLYFAKNRDTAERYKVSTGNTANFLVGGKEYYSNGDWIYEADGTPIGHSSPLSILAPFIDEDSTQESVLKDVDKYIKMDSAPDASEGEKQELERLKKAKEVLEGGRFSMKKPSENHRLYEVNIPDDDSLLDEQKSFSEQPEKVKRGIEQAFKSVDDNLKENLVKRVLDYNDEGDVLGKNYVFDEYKAEHQNEDGTVNYADFFKELDKKDYGVDGQAIYDGFSSVGANFVNGFNDENASKLLNKYGIKGITYEGSKDGRCFVVFDDKAISIIDKYNQQQAQIQGQTTVTGDMISLFDAADQSTFMHESAHWYLINMQKLALNENASQQFVEDFMTLQQWFGNKKLDADISVEQHEKFARGFEAYLRTGKAPAPQLHGIFNRFKSWLTSIYRDFKQLGGKPTKEVTAVMDRMLATEDEISMAMKEQMVDDFKRAGGMKLMLDENARTWERWYQKVREEAEAKVLEKAMKDLEEADRKDIAEAIEAKREQVASEMGQDDFWRADEMVRMNGENLDVLADFNLTPEEYQEELKKRGGSFEAALDAQMKGFTEEMQESRLDTETLYEDAKKAVQDSEYQEMLHALEYEALAAKAKAYIAGEDEAAAKAQAREDKATEKANNEAAEAAEKARKIAEKLEVQEDQRNEKVKEAQTEMRNMKAGIRIVRDTVLKTVSERRAMARQSLSTLPINQATNVALWAKKLGQKQYEVFRLMSKGEWDKAANAKQQQLLLAAMVTESGRFKKLIDRQAARIQKNIQTLQKGNERMPAAERYWYQHLAYVLGLARNDGLPPSKGIPKLEELFLWLTGSPNEKESEVKIPQWLDALGNQTQRIGMEKLSPNGWEYVNKIMKALYKMSRQKDKLNVVELNGVKGARIDEAASALADNLIEHNGIHIKEDPYDANRWTDKRKRNMKDAKDFLGSYFNKLIAPLTIFQRMDGYIGKTGKNVTGLAIKTLYDPVMRATNEEIKLQAEFAAGLKDAFGAYTGEELDDIRNKRIYRFGNRLLTKEQIMCMALTAGTESGYKRVLDNEPVGQEFKSLQIRERVVADLFNDVLKELDKRDWATITKVWNLMGAHYEDESGVKERTTGIPLGKLAHRSFSVTGKDGNTYQLRGGYYPVVYDSDQSVRTSNLEEVDTLKSMAPGVARMGQGKGFTKSRATTVTDRPLSLSFDVIGNKGGEMMHYIAFRETALDVNRIINDRKFTKAVVDSMGMEEYKALRDWASDIWQAPKEGKEWYDRLVRRLRTRTTAAVLMYRTSTMLLNVANAPLMMMYCGVDNFVSAFKDFYTHPEQNLRLVNGLSPFMAKRSERMDTNLREAMESQNKKLHASKLTQAIMGNGFKLIGMTDNMFAYPLWYSEYRKTLNQEIQMGHDNETAQRNAISAGDRAVVRVIGSGEMKDLSKAQKGGEMAKALTMFYTFQNALYNMAANKYYAGLQAAERAGKTGWRRYASRQFMAPMAHYLLLGIMVNSAIEMGIRGAMEALGGGDDKEKKDAAYWLRKFSQTSMDNQAATIPILRDIWRPVSRSIFEPDAKWFGNSAKMTSALDSFVRLSDAGVTASSVIKNDGKKNLADIVRDGGRAINGIAGSPDMLSDGIANSIQYFLYPNSERDLRQLMGAIVMDRKLSKPKKNTAKKTGDPFKDAKRKAQRERNAAKKKAKNKVK